jgi:hypothetical protein
MESNVKLYSLPYSELKTYWLAAAFIAGNIILPQLCHLIPQGGMMLLPIYFFTLVGAYKFGWRVGLLTAVFSPLVNTALFGMPAAALLPVILLKSVLLAIAAGWAASHFRKASLPLLVGVVAFYQLLGGVGEWAITGSAASALQDIRLGLPGIAFQILGAYMLINFIIRK